MIWKSLLEKNLRREKNKIIPIPPLNALSLIYLCKWTKKSSKKKPQVEGCFAPQKTIIQSKQPSPSQASKSRTKKKPINEIEGLFCI